MPERELTDKIDVYLKKDYLRGVSGTCALWEREDNGRTRLNVLLPDDAGDSALWIDDFDNKPKCKFLNEANAADLKSSVDHVLLTRRGDGAWNIHLIEMKSGIRRERWEEIKRKARASLLNVKALAAVLDLPIGGFSVYTTYERISETDADPANPAERRAHLGWDWKRDEWDAGRIPLRVPRGGTMTLSHKGVQMRRETVDGKSTLCGELSLR